jgi:c-di-GMP-binding flagellar brake protein YcgR
MGLDYLERRQSPRIEINARGKITVISRGLRIIKSVNCTVANISEGGALLSFKTPISENEFYLEIEDDPDRRFYCAVLRRLGKSVAVRFVKPLM